MKQYSAKELAELTFNVKSIQERFPNIKDYENYILHDDSYRNKINSKMNERISESYLRNKVETIQKTILQILKSRKNITFTLEDIVKEVASRIPATREDLYRATDSGRNALTTTVSWELKHLENKKQIRHPYRDCYCVA